MVEKARVTPRVAKAQSPKADSPRPAIAAGQTKVAGSVAPPRSSGASTNGKERIRPESSPRQSKSKLTKRHAWLRKSEVQGKM